MFAHERHQAIRSLVKKHRRLSFTELQAAIDVSPATLRRDLTDLEQSGDVIRVHGGVLDPAYVRSEVSFDERMLRHAAAKKAIAAAVSALIPPGSTVFVDAGSTCLEAGKTLLARKDLRLISHSVALTAASLHGQADFLCLGGELRRVSGALVGSAALGALAHIRADFALLGASGVDAQECYTTELSEAGMKHAMIERSRRTILLADTSKWNAPSTVSFADWTRFDDWVTDKPLPTRETRAVREAGVTLHAAARR